MRARFRTNGTSTPAWRSAARRRGRTGFAGCAVLRCQWGDRATSSGAREQHGASRAPGCSLCGATQLYSTSDVVTTRPELYANQDQGRLPGPGRGPQTAWASWSGSSSGLWVGIVMSPTRPGGASSTSGS